MDEPGKFINLKNERRLKYLGIVVGLVIFTIQRYTGNDYTHLLVLLYFMFLLPSIGLDRAAQERYFPFSQQFFAALRAVTIVITLIVLGLYIYAMSTPLGQPITLPDHLKYPHELKQPE
ncbi:hypothetical protein L2725_08155 [Shewanella corallii]|uniref:DUF805 domain-containing protein n=1 Tax=Shewanella corallii TaxID=560080 RepID=A0ABT0N5R7_9GAMM|nr:hypothetical protein [Shewanella corallii]MCL2913763.1 hypothetical protein [Shewanella corallii]